MNLFKKKEKIDAPVSAPKSERHSPYLNARQEWLERYGSYISRATQFSKEQLPMCILIMGCVGIVMDILVLLYISYIKNSAIFIIGAIGVSIASPFFIIFIYDIYKSLKECRNNIDKFDYIMLFAGESSMIYVSIIIFIKYA